MSDTISYPNISLKAFPPLKDWAGKAVPTINKEKTRIANIIEGLPAKFDIKDNPKADGSKPRQEFEFLGDRAVKEHQLRRIRIAEQLSLSETRLGQLSS